MPRAHYRCLLALLSIALLSFLFSLDTSTTLHTFDGLESQAKVWNEGGKWRIFSALQLLCFSLLSWFVAYHVVWARARRAGMLWLLANASLAAYFLVDPRYKSSDFSTLLLGILLFCAGSLIAYLLPYEKAKAKYTPYLQTLGLLLVFFPALFFARLLTQVGAESIFALSSASLLSFYVYLAGSIAVVSFRERLPLPLPLAALERKDVLCPKYARASLLLTPVLCTLICVGVAGKVDFRKSYYGLFAPLVPPVMSVYAPLAWFQAEEASEIFPSILEQEEAGERTRTRAKLYMALFFQYLFLLTFAVVFLAWRKYSHLRLILAQCFLLAYFMPSFWLAELAARHY